MIVYVCQKVRWTIQGLKSEVLDVRSKEQRIDFNWLWSKARKNYREQKNNEYDMQLQRNMLPSAS